MQQQLAPAQALRTLSSAYTQPPRVSPLRAGLSLALLVVGITLYLMVPGIRPLTPLFGLCSLVCLPAMLGRSALRQQEHERAREQAHSALLLIVKDQSDRLEAPDLLFALRRLAPTAAPPLPELLRARLTEKLPYTDRASLIALPKEDHAWLRKALLAPESDEALIVAILLAMGDTPDTKVQEAMRLLGENGKTERIREAARDALLVGGR